MKRLGLFLNLVCCTLLWLSISKTNGQSNNICLDCSPYFSNDCKGQEDLFVCEDADVDNFVEITDSDTYEKHLSKCLPKHLKLIADLDEYICFALPRCTCVANQNYTDVKYACEEAKGLCKCEDIVNPKKKKGSGSVRRESVHILVLSLGLMKSVN